MEYVDQSILNTGLTFQPHTILHLVTSGVPQDSALGLIL